MIRGVLMLLCCVGFHSWEYMEPRVVLVGDMETWRYPRACRRCRHKEGWW